MATIDAPTERTMFVRKATGLTRGWSPFDGFIYAFFACNIFVGMWVWTFATFIPSGSLFWAIVIATAFIAFEVIVYAALVAAMPRAGGDYVWQSRILHGSVGFVLAATGWWFILWHWVPIYANITVITFFDPVFRLFGATGIADWFAGKHGVFFTALLVIALTAAYVGIGMRGYAKIQRWTFYLGMVGLAVAALLLLISSKADFVSAFNREATDLYGAGANAYNATLEAGGADWVGTLEFPLKGTFLLVPMVIFYLLWPNWGATLYGEVRGASDFRKNVLAMGAALATVAVISLIFIGLIAKTMGWDFFNAANSAWWGGTGAFASYPYPIMMAGWLVDSSVFQFVLITLASLLVFGWYGTVFLSSTRVIFAAAFDRILPEWAASVSPRTRAPNVALALMVLPSIPVAALYAYWGDFATYVLDATVVIAVTYLGTTIAALILPWRLRRVYEASPLAKWEVAGIPLISVAAFIFASFLVFNLVLWLKDAVYGVNNRDSMIYMGILYALAIVIYVAAWVVRRQQGMALGRVQREIPAE